MKTITLTLLVSFALSGSNAQDWKLNGNSGTNPDSNFLGTINNRDLVLRTNNIERLRVAKNGKVGLGTTAPQQKLDVNGNINVAEGSGIYSGNERVLYCPKGGAPFPNVFVGQLAGNKDGGFLNTAVGYEALHAVKGEGNGNAAMGSYALMSNTHGSSNSAFGYSALRSNTTGYDNTACGTYALGYNITGSLNTAIGWFALLANTTGSNNTATGFQVLSANTTGNNNTANGYYALTSDSTGSYNTAVGNYADINNGDITNSTIIGNNTLAMASNQVRLGNSDVTSIGGYTDWTNISDGRVKKNIKENVPGLIFINKLKPFTYNLDLDAADKIVQRPVIKNKDGEIVSLYKDIAARKAKEQIVYTGFIAQDVERAAKELNYDFSGVDAAKNDKDLYGLRYAAFVVPLVKAVQELSAKNEDLQKQIDELKTMIASDQSAADVKQSTGVSSASLEQNSPNPFAQSTSIRYYLPAKFTSAQIQISDYSGKILRQITITTPGTGILNVERKMLAAGTYNYALIADGRLIDTKKMIVIK
ncbi:MAG TPA: tail fiber domain-containing protein [Parafilimonas sp.]|nr:tail fiber domain-containing protein [Parafilimonas sp.]